MVGLAAAGQGKMCRWSVWHEYSGAVAGKGRMCRMVDGEARLEVVAASWERVQVTCQSHLQLCLLASPLLVGSLQGKLKMMVM